MFNKRTTTLVLEDIDNKIADNIFVYLNRMFKGSFDNIIVFHESKVGNLLKECSSIFHRKLGGRTTISNKNIICQLVSSQIMTYG